jgi:hypothetical protein
MRLHDDPKISPTRRSAGEPNDSHKFLDIVSEMGGIRGDFIRKGSSATIEGRPPNLNPKAR